MPLSGIRKDQLKPSFLTNATSLVWEIGWQMKFFGVPVFIQLAEVEKLKSLYVIFFSRKILFVARGAMKSVGIHGGDPPKGWLFHHRWKDGGICPKSKNLLVREQIGGRTSCWSPARQSMELAK